MCLRENRPKCSPTRFLVKINAYINLFGGNIFHQDTKSKVFEPKSSLLQI
jgi:hypothetical protein